MNNKCSQTTQCSDQTPADHQGFAESLDEYTASAYVSFGHEFKKGIGLYLTLTGEYYSIEDYRRFNLLPSVSFSCPITEQQALKLSFVTMRDTPSYGMQQKYIN